MFGRRRRGQPSPGDEPNDVFIGLREQVLGLDPAVLELSPTPDQPRVWGGLMDIGYPSRRWATLVAVADGTVSLYTSTGGGTIGAGAYPAVATAAGLWLRELEDRLDLLPLTGPAPPLPDPEQVVIRALLFDGQAAVVAAEDDLGNLRHPAAPLFHAAHGVIAQMRLAERR